MCSKGGRAIGRDMGSAGKSDAVGCPGRAGGSPVTSRNLNNNFFLNHKNDNGVIYLDALGSRPAKKKKHI